MIRLKSETDLEMLAEGGKILAEILDELCAAAKPGMMMIELDDMARKLIDRAKCVPAFLKYAPKGQHPYPAALCVSINEAVVHGLPGKQFFKEGDVVGIDLGLIYNKKYYLDSARTVGIGKLTKQKEHLLEVTREALERGIAQALVGNRIGDIGEAVQSYVEAEGLNVVHQLVGHGVGFGVHEEPQVPNFGRRRTGLKLERGLVLAIEPMVTIGDPAVETAADGWTVIAPKGTVAAHEEHTVAVTSSGPRVLTR